MSNFRLTSLTRKQLALFLPNHESIKEFERLFDQDIKLISGTGLNQDGSYPTRTDSNFLNSSQSLYEDSTILDNVMLELIVSTSIDITLDNTSQTVFADATAGELNITLPSPSDSINNGRSFRIAIHKIDSSINNVNILPSGSELVVFESSQVLSYQAEILNFITDGTNWYLGA